MYGPHSRNELHQTLELIPKKSLTPPRLLLTSGTASAKAGFISNAKNSPTVEQLAGTGVAQDSHQVDLTWNQGDPNAVGYNIYRGSAQSGPFTQINNALDAATNYTDSNVVSGTTYYYVATEVNAQGEESAYSNVVKAVVPNP